MGGSDSTQVGEAAVYCRVAHRRSPRQAGVDQREARCRELADRHGLHVAPWRVFIDPLATSWARTDERDGRRPGWDALLRDLRTGPVTHVLIAGTDELEQFHPWDLAALLTLADARDLVLLDPEQEVDLNTPAARSALRERTRERCRRREDASGTTRTAQSRAAADGRPHGGGRRAFGYTQSGHELVPDEAAVVARIYHWYLTDRSLSWIARELTTERIPTAAGGRWTSTKVARILDAPRYAALQVRQGEVLRDASGAYVPGSWEPCVSLSQWEAAQELRRSAELTTRAERRPERHYRLTGLVRCGRCGRRMVGETKNGYPMYGCIGRSTGEGEPCHRYISATRLEELVDEHVLFALENAQLPSEGTPAAVLDPKTAEGRDHDQARLAELPAPTATPEPQSTREHAALAARIRKENRMVAVRVPDAVGPELTGRHTRRNWHRLSASRRDDVRRFLIAHIDIGPVTGPRSVFDPARVLILRHPD
ncbi:recombinase family protein [Streptacidiphilus fuscans]|uniref:Recombinase family protein n=1 Tax=Streptacidiphilus fuscans TaxID=2789292 RepID=A0A931B5T8_9ACTN|nr:recombinase family protein [Streptacidiphilus fuscans]MBF9069982.1 recombinase family protein [Streptacidiphilus fuscans]